MKKGWKKVLGKIREYPGGIKHFFAVAEINGEPYNIYEDTDGKWHWFKKHPPTPLGEKGE